MALRPHAPPPPSGPASRVQMTLRVVPETKERLLALAALRRTSASHLVEEALAMLCATLGEEEREELETLLAAAQADRRGSSVRRGR